MINVKHISDCKLSCCPTYVMIYFNRNSSNGGNIMSNT